jgi:hypothetical protein
MQTLPVDLVQSAWDYVVDIADITAGVGAAGALFVAAMVYRRQVEDVRQAQASMVTVTVTSKKASGLDPRDGIIYVVINNYSSLPIYQVKWSAWRGNGLKEELPDMSAIRPDGVRMYTFPNDYVDDKMEAEIRFNDSRGHRWIRHTSGALKQVSAAESSRIAIPSPREPLDGQEPPESGPRRTQAPSTPRPPGSA